MAAAPVLPTSPALIPEPAPLSEGARIIDTFIAPSKTFSDLGRTAKWWSWVIPILIISIFSILFAYAVGQKIGYDKATENVLQTRPKQYDRIQAMNAEDRDEAMRQAVTQTKNGTYTFPVAQTVILLLVAGVLLASFKFGTNVKVSFKVVLAIVAYASLPAIIKFLLATITLYAGMSPDNFNVQNPLATNLGVLFNATENPVLYLAASFVDLIAIWTLVLTAIGFTSVSKVKLSTALAIVLAWYILFAGLLVGLTSLFV